MGKPFRSFSQCISAFEKGFFIFFHNISSRECGTRDSFFPLVIWSVRPLVRSGFLSVSTQEAAGVWCRRPCFCLFCHLFYFIYLFSRESATLHNPLWLSCPFAIRSPVWYQGVQKLATCGRASSLVYLYSRSRLCSTTYGKSVV